MLGQPLILPSHNSVSVSDLSCDLFSAVHLLQYISKTFIRHLIINYSAELISCH